MLQTQFQCEQTWKSVNISTSALFGYEKTAQKRVKKATISVTMAELSAHLVKRKTLAYISTPAAFYISEFEAQ